MQPPPALSFPTSGGFSSYTGQGTNSTGTLTVEEQGKTVHLTDKMWRKIQLSSLGLPTYYQLTANTVLSFDFYSSEAPGIAAIGLDDNNASNDPVRHFQIAGTDSSSQFIGLSPGVAYSGGWQHYAITLADFAGYAAYQGSNYQSYWRWLVFVNNGSGESFFRNIRLTEGPPVGSVLESTSYVYDAEGRRVLRIHDPDGANSAQSATSQYFVYDGSQLAMTFNDSKELTHRYLYGPQVDQVLVDEVFTAGAGGQRVSDEVLWLLADHQGTIRDVVDDTGALRNHIEYDSFGNITQEGVPQPAGSGASAEAIDQLFYFQGREWDADTKLQNNRARWYDPGSGRFLSQDPSGFDGGDPNLYRYVGNSPLNATDPTGQFKQR